MNAAVISLGSVSSQWTADAMKVYFEEVDFLNLKSIDINLGAKDVILYEGKPIKHYDCVFVKGSFRYATLLRAISVILEGDSFLAYKPTSFTMAHDKILTHLQLEKANIPMPKTYLSPTVEAAKIILKNMIYPVVMKLPSGTQGRGVMFADSYASASSLLDTLVALKQPFLIQEYIESGGSDIRAIVIGDKVVASMKRIASKSELRSNIHAGGAGVPCDIDWEAKRIAIRTAEAVGSLVCGVDMIESVKGPMVLEVNLSPGLQGITDATGINVAQKIAKYLGEKTEEFLASKGKIQPKDLVKKKVNLDKHELITSLQFKANRVLLPEIVTKITRFNDVDDYIINMEKESLKITKFKLK